MRYRATSTFKTNALHCHFKFFTIFGLVDGFLGSANHLNVEFFQYSFALQIQCAVQSGLATHGWQYRVRPFFFNNTRDVLPVNRLDVGSIGRLRIGHDRCRIGIDQDDTVALFLQRLTGLGARVIKLTTLTNDNRTGANNKYAVDVSTL